MVAFTAPSLDMARKLVVFDFDLSLANANTDTEVIKKLAGSEIWEEVKRQFPQLRASWSDQMVRSLATSTNPC